MKFSVTQTSGKSLCSSVNLKSIKDLLQFIYIVGTEVVVNIDHDGVPSLEIYNDYRE
jgi:hypothetical protein